MPIFSKIAEKESALKREETFAHGSAKFKLRNIARPKERERESLFTITKHKHNSKPILHKLGGLPEGHTPITAGHPLLMSTKHSNVQ